MNSDKLKEYLSMVVDMENNLYLQQTLGRNLKNEINELSVTYSYTAPLAPEAPKAPVFEDPGKNVKLLRNCSLIGFVLVIIVMFVPTLGVLSIIGGPLFLFGGLAYLWNLISLSDKRKAEDEKHAEYKKRLAEYQKKLAEYHADMKRYQEQIAAEKVRRVENAKKHEVLIREFATLNNQYHQSKENLERLYSANIIFPKYRNLVMVTSLYEYICSGRCSTLEGHEGAYNILEMEIRLDRIVTQLDNVIKQLEKIQENQYSLYRLIQDSNRRSAQLLDATNHMALQLDAFRGTSEALTARVAELQQTSALTAYHTERTQKELAYMNRMNYLTGRNDGVWNNRPPM